MKCSGPLYLPTEEDRGEELERATAWGHMVHHWKETGNIEAPDRRTASAFRKAINASGVVRGVLWPKGGHHEQPIAVRIDGNRQVLNSNSEVFGNPKWATGTDDFHWWFLDGALWIDDLKTGKWYDDGYGENRFPQDPRSPQLRLYALAVSQLLNYTGIVHVSITHWPRLPVDRRHSPPIRYWTQYTTEELNAFWNDLEQLYRESQAGHSGDFNLHPGDHCRFCPARTNCFVAQEPEPFQWRH
jgi:hypothetical protein